MNLTLITYLEVNVTDLFLVYHGHPDIFESLYSTINVLFVDELIDSGMDSNGVEASLAVLKKMQRERGRSIFLVSHRDELYGRVTNVLNVIKENGFTSFSQEDELEIEETKG